MGREVHAARITQQISAGLLLAAGQQGPAIAAGGVITRGRHGVVDRQQPSLAQASPGLRQPRPHRRAPFTAPALRAPATTGRQTQLLQLLHNIRRQSSPQLPARLLLPIEAHQPLMPAAVVQAKTLHGQGIDELMGQDQSTARFSCQLLRIAPAHRQISSSQGLLLAQLQCRAALHQHQLEPLPPIRGFSADPSGEIAQQLAIAWAPLDQRQWSWLGG